jgi:hypothetical protein
MNYLSFGLSEQTFVGGRIRTAITRVSLEFAFHGRPVHLTLWRPDNTELLVHSDMHDVAERREVEILQFSYVFAQEARETIVETAAAIQRRAVSLQLISDKNPFFVSCRESDLAFLTNSISTIPQPAD